MRHILLTFGISLLLGAMALPTQAQVVNGHVTFLGIPLNETPQGIANGSVLVGYSNQDEMDGASDFYYVSSTYNDQRDN